VTPTSGGIVIVFDAMITGKGDLTINADPASPFVRQSGGAASSDGGTSGDAAAVLGGGPQAAGAGSALAAATRSAASATSANPAALDQVFASNAGGTVAALSGASNGVRPERATVWVDPLSGELADELVSSLVGAV
jgi:hypothetical protein